MNSYCSLSSNTDLLRSNVVHVSTYVPFLRYFRELHEFPVVQELVSIGSLPYLKYQ